MSRDQDGLRHRADMDLIQSRLLGTRAYLVFRARCSIENWPEGFRRFRASRLRGWGDEDSLNTPQVMALCDPELWLDGLDCELEEVLNRRTFAGVPQGADCESEALFGYPCPLEGQVIQADHLFPYSLGGKTDPGNRLNLCRLHNRIKGSDIHFYPWEQAPRQWVCDLLESVGDRMGLT